MINSINSWILQEYFHKVDYFEVSCLNKSIFMNEITNITSYKICRLCSKDKYPGMDPLTLLLLKFLKKKNTSAIGVKKNS